MLIYFIVFFCLVLVAVASNFNDTSTTPNQLLSPVEKIIGNTLYKWANTKETVYQSETKDLLKNADVVGLYFSASWYVFKVIFSMTCF
jgi:hypothetical protein